MTKILLTGSAGYLGTHLYLKLKELGHNVLGIDQRPHTTVDLVIDISDARAVEGNQYIFLAFLDSPTFLVAVGII